MARPKGGIPWNKGLKYTDEMKAKIDMSGLNKGVPWNKGKKASEESKKKMSESQKLWFAKGNKHPMLGKKHSQKTRNHWSKIRKGIDFRSPATIKKIKEEWSKRRGVEVHSWKGGVTKVHRIVRAMFEYSEWRSKILKRDDFTCQLCNERGGRLNVDHIVPFSFILEVEHIKNMDGARNCEFLWDIENGRTLCEKCHKESPSALYRKLLIERNILKQELNKLKNENCSL